jgi:hypothetical protein
MTKMSDARREKRVRKTQAEKVQDAVKGLIREGEDTMPPGVAIFPNMEAAWNELTEQFCKGLPRKQRQDAKFIFYHGVQAAANLMIYCAGQSNFECAADQITKDCVDYEKEAELTLRERLELIEAEPKDGAKPD